eukprot:Transcript_7259.p1 GENE.Transcript_7259~~Transcript_7259.p1  ORF type:complete len:579 (+),score=268.32 Transcript_7259:45-1781(+)
MAKGGAGKGSRGSSHRVARTSTSTSSLLKASGKAARRNAAKQQREHNRRSMQEMQRSAAGAAGAPKVVAIVSAGAGADTEEVARLLFAHADEPPLDGATCVLSKQRQRLTLLRPARRLDAVLDAMKAADVLMLVIPADGGLDEEGERTVDAVCMTGVPTVVGVLQGQLPHKQQAAARKQWASSLETRFPDHAKLYSLDLDPDASQLLRHLAGLTPRQLEWRKAHPYVLCHAHSVVEATAEAPAALQLTGYVRGNALSVNRLVHVPGFGDFPIRTLEVLDDPHPQENLPPEYAKIYQFQDWPALQRHVRREQEQQAAADEEEGLRHARPGAFVRITVEAPAGFSAALGATGGVGGPGCAPLVVCGLNTYENRMTVLHFTISLSATAEAAELSVRGKQPLVLRCGFRSFACQPIFSEDNRRGDKHKLERFLQPGRTAVATIYAPAIFAPAPMLAFLPADDPQAPATGGWPVATGSLLSADSDRIILKKVVLTGHPFRCHKSKVVVRWMFFTPEDIRWFKPVELSTKFGRKGHIKESLGTHGYMKCQFDKPIQQHDTICMNLYKRSFPKWGSFSHALHPQP